VRHPAFYLRASGYALKEPLREAGEEVSEMRKVLLALLAGLLIGAVVAGAGFSGTRAKTVAISTRKIPKLGTVLVNSKGMTLYMFVPDKDKKVTCVHACAAVWPPLYLPKGGKPAASGQVKASLLGSDPDPTGGRVVTYAGWPLYTYVVDRAPGSVKGQALNLNGGLWYVLGPSGNVIRTKVKTGY
jgi:predicted lipoprotein with Yx(FWY)xxD motif